MVFSSTVFLIVFLPITVALYYNPLTKRLSRLYGAYPRNIILLIASIFFYAWGEPVYIFLMLFSIVITYFVGRGIALNEYSHAKAFLSIGIVYHVLMLFVFKYSSFLLSQFFLIRKNGNAVEYNIALPIGISFYTFQLMSYLFDVYYRKTRVQKNILFLALYAMLFPQLIAGPIVRYNEIIGEIQERSINVQLLSEGVERFIYGLGKKVLLADSLAYTVDTVWSLDVRTIGVAWLGAICYTLQIYFDFSGYSDMAIGLGKMFGFHFSENFNYPYVSKSVTEFWRRWHISLSAWFRDYVYIPLGGNRVSRGKWVRNLFVVWLLTGIWHGANWTFLCWGMIYFVILLLEKITNFQMHLKWFSHVYTMLIVTMAWVVFRSDSLADGFKFIGEMFGVGNHAMEAPATMSLVFVGTLFSLALSILFSMPVVPKVSAVLKGYQPQLWLGMKTITTIGVFVLTFIRITSAGYTTFLYFNF